ncbi:MAG TPA: MarR family transcriptional regulator [Streptosporangiaceae bacterium]|nr:MarR family transcriptional regulator [Streptosporangiaceae bacterium]
MSDEAKARPAMPEHGGFAFLLVQLGMEAARQFAKQLAPLGVEPRQAGMLYRLAANEGKAQQVIGELIGLNPTQMVFLVDELEGRGFIERRRNPADRRSYALYLTPAGRDMLSKIREAGRVHQEGFGASLSETEQGQLTELLRRIASDQHLAGESLPGIPPRRR